jgi:hypothetical protein
MVNISPGDLIMTSKSLPLLAATLALAASPLAAEAGKLGQATRSISQKQQSSRSSSGSSAPRPQEQQPSNRGYIADSGYYYGQPYYYSPLAMCTTCAPQVRATSTAPAEPTHLDLFLAYENVRDSDGSLNIAARISRGPIGFGFTSSSYFESARLDKGEPEEGVNLTLWDASVRGRALRVADATELWLSLGLSGLHSNQFEDVLGGAAGAEIRHHLTPALRVEGGARGMLYPDDVNAAELRAGVTASVLHAGYRYLRFNVGPALQGPEVGLSLRF